MKTYIYASRREDVEKKLVSLAKKAFRYGVHFGYAFGDTVARTVVLYRNVYSPADHCMIKEPYAQELVEAVELTIDSDALIKKGRWTVAARLEHMDGGNIVSPFVEITPEITAGWHGLKPHCDHCGVDRTRNVTFIVWDAEHNMKQVGCSCLHDYTGIDPELATSFATVIEEVTVSEANGDNYDGERERSNRIYSTEWVIANAVEEIAKHGHQKRDSEKPTSIAVGERMARGIAPSDKSVEKARKIVRWLQDCNVSWDLVQNCAVLARGGYCKGNHIGLLAYIPVAYDREMERARAREIEKASEYVGNVGERITRKLSKAEYVTSFSGMYGDTHLYRFTDDDGNVLVWFASNMTDVCGAKSVTGTVKKQEERSGVKQTILTRCKVA